MKLEDSEEENLMERTLALIKPNVLERVEEIEEIFQNEGFEILQKKTVEMSKEQASDFYAEYVGKSFFQYIIDYVTSGPVMTMVLTRENAVEKLKELIGPKSVPEAKALQPQSLRAKFGSEEYKNGIHGSSSIICAEREIGIFFPELAVSSTVTGQAAKAYLAETVNPILLKGLTELCKQKPQNPIIWLADWLLINNPNNNTPSNKTSEDEQSN